MASLNHYRIQILIDRKDGSSLFNNLDLLEISAIDSFIMNNMSMTDPISGKKRGYRQLCGLYCNESNALVLGFIRVFFLFDLIFKQLKISF